MTTNKTTYLLLVALFLCNLGFGQPSEKRISKGSYIEMWQEEAVQQMIKYKIPASITLAQGILESGSGNSELAKYGNNHFGIKCHNWEGEGIYIDDDKKNECFRKYSDASASFEDHSKFLAHRGRYSSLFDLEITDYKNWAKGLRKAGYATNPKYADLLIRLIEENDLDQYDTQLLVVENKPARTTDIALPNAIISKPKANVHQVFVHNNNIKYIKIKEGDTFYKISKEFDLSLWQLYKYNNLSDNSFIKIDDMLFLQPKKAKNSKRSHTVKKGETLHKISQLYGVKLKSLYKKNKLGPESILQIGQKIKLK